MAKVLVAICAHADDVELNAGGTVAKWAAGGGQVHVLMMTDNCSGLKMAPGACAAVRRREQEAAAALYHGKVHYCNYAQRHYYSQKLGGRVCIDYASDVPVPDYIKGHRPLVIAHDKAEEIEKLGDLIVGLNPDLVLTQTPLDLDPEHHAVACMVWAAFQQFAKELADAPLRYWMPGSTCLDGLQDMGYDHYEDISDFYEAKLQLCACHASQMSERRWGMVKDRAAFFGRKAGVQYAEPFATATRDIVF